MRNSAPAPRPLYGGQAVIEGVMIRGVRHYSLAVRRPDGNIFCTTEAVNSRFSGRVRRVPFVRGVPILAETLWLGDEVVAAFCHYCRRRAARQ